jgi:hypothetical protein
MDEYAENAKGLARAMLDAGRPLEWVIMMTSAYYGQQIGREAALSAIEERELQALHDLAV